MKTLIISSTFAIESVSKRAYVEAALESFSTQSSIDHPLRLKGGHRGLITVPDTEPGGHLGGDGPGCSEPGSSSSCRPRGSRALPLFLPGLPRRLASPAPSGHEDVVRNMKRLS